MRSARGRVLAQSVSAAGENPSQALAAMDGIAVDSLAIHSYPARLTSSDCARVNTGEKLPEGFNAVVKIEDVTWEQETAVIAQPVEFHQHVRHAGEDFSAGRLLLSAGHLLKAQDLSLLLASHCEEVQVYAKPVVAFVPTGSEFLSPATESVESNSAMVGGLVDQWGGSFYLSAPIPDDPSILSEKILALSETADVIVVSAGTSMGTADFTETALQSVGSIWFHGVALSPAKPVLYGEVHGKPVLGLPGYPVSAYVASYVYLRRILSYLSSIPLPPQQSIYISAEEYPSREMDTFLRVHVYDVDGMQYAAKIPRGASSILSLSQMDGLLHIPARTPVKKRDAVRVDVIQDHYKHTVIMKGDSDPLLDQLLDLFRDESLAFRALFWETSQQEALQSIIERNTHLAVLASTPDLPDPFPEFAHQLQEVMFRYRMFGRAVGLVYKKSTRMPERLNAGNFRIVVPRQRHALWKHWLEKNALNPSQFHVFETAAPDKVLLSSLELGKWDGVFSDVRFLMDDQNAMAPVSEYLDLVVSETYLNFAPIKKLIDLLLSDAFATVVNSTSGCEIRSRGLLQEAPY